MTSAGDLLDKFRMVSEENYLFACQASVPLVFTPDLLYQLWNNFKQYDYEFSPGTYYKISHLAVSDLLLSPLCEPVGFEIYQLKKDVRKILAEELVIYLGKKRRYTIARFLQEYAGIDSNFRYRKKLRAIHALTAQSILDPGEMERQIVNQINQAKTDSEKIDLLLLHKNIVPLGFDSDLSKISGPLGTRLNPTLVIEEDPDAQGVLSVNLPQSLRAQVRTKVKISKPEGSLKKSPAEQLIDECIRSSGTYLNLGFCGLTDADFAKGTVLDRELRRCTHIQSLRLTNVSPYAQHERSVPFGAPNNLNFIPECVSDLTNLEIFECSGSIENKWGIQDLSVLKSLGNLRALDLSLNRIQRIPMLPSPQFLHSLFLAGNEIETLEGISAFLNLNGLDVSDNKITSLKPLVPLLERAEEPIEISVSIFVKNNPIVEPPPEIVAKGRTSILEYFSTKAPIQARLQSLVGEVRSNASDSAVFGFIVKGSELGPKMSDELFFLTIAQPGKQYPAELSVRFPGIDQVFSLSDSIVWSSSIDKLDFFLCEFPMAENTQLTVMIDESKLSHFRLANSISEKELIANPSLAPGTPLLNREKEVIGINAGLYSKAATSILAIKTELQKAFNSIDSINGNVLRIYVLYSTDVERETKDLSSYISRTRKYWVEQMDTLIHISFLSDKQIQSDNDFPILLTHSDILIALPGDPGMTRMYNYLQNVLIELFKYDEENPGPSVFVFTRAGLQPAFRDWVISMHGSASSYIMVDDINECVDKNLRMMALAKKYQLTRETMPGSNRRTEVMENITIEMKNNADGILPYLDSYTNSASPGKRLSAIAALETNPNPRFMLWLAGRVGNDEKPFVGYRASVAIAVAVNSGKIDSSLARDAVDVAWASLKLSSFRDPNQVMVIGDLRKRMELDKAIKPEVSMFAGSWLGLYTEQAGNTEWDLEIILRADNKLIGLIRDKGPLGKADIHGGIFPDRNFIFFSKKYRRRDKSYYQVEYAGEWKTPALITGTWTIYGKTNTTGTFEMRKVNDRNI